MLALAGLAAACGSAKPPAPDDAPRAAAKAVAPVEAAAPAEIAARPLGEADLTGYDWRKRPGQPAFRMARAAEARNDWASVATLCRQALAADPTNLEAAWLLAAALGELGEAPSAIVPPLQVAAAGDFGKWGNASLENPALAKFRDTPTGAAWKRRVDEDRATYTAALARSVVVLARGDLYAFDPSGPRWYRLTRSGTVLGALAAPSAHQLGYIARVRVKGKPEAALGIIDLAKGTQSRPVPLGDATAQIAFSTGEPTGFWVDTRTGWHQLDEDFRWHPVGARPRPAGAWLAVTPTSARLHASPGNVTADWDDQGLASAIRIGSSNRIVAVPSPGLIARDTAAWSPDRTRLAFVAQLDDQCTPASSTAAFVADAATGQLTELERATGGLAVEWVADRKLAIAGDKGVALASLDGGAPVPIAGASGLAVPRQRPRCTPLPTEAAPDEEPPESGDD
jgi:hypothetical protein